MKKFTSTILLLLPAAAMFAQQGNPFTLKGTITNAKGSEKVFLLYKNDMQSITDSATLINGTFWFKGNIAYPAKATLYIGHQGESIEVLRHTRKVDMAHLYLEAADIQIKGADSIYNAAITGGQSNADNQQMLAMTKPFDDQSDKVEAEENAVPKEKQTPQLHDQYEKRYNAIDAEKKVALGRFIIAHPASWVSLDALEDYGGYYPEYTDLEPMYSILSPELKNSAFGKVYADLIPKLKLVAIGAQAPVFAQNDKDGQSISITSFKGKYLLIDFWASWCGPCRRENPNVVKAYNLFKDKNFTILGVSLDEETGREKWLKAVAHDGLVWTQVSDLKYWKNEAASLYGVHAIPQNFLLDPNGKIIAKNLEGKGLTDTLAEILNSKGAVKATNADK